MLMVGRIVNIAEMLLVTRRDFFEFGLAKRNELNTMYQLLIVDDESVEREVIRYLLQQKDFPLEVSEAVNGKAALELLAEKEFHILITDICMPFCDGLTLANKARERYPNIQIIFFSGHNDFAYAKEALSLKAVNYILKPIAPEEFWETMSGTLERIHTRDRLTEEQITTERCIRNHIIYRLANKTTLKQLQELYPQIDMSFTKSCNMLYLIQLERTNSNLGEEGNSVILSYANLASLLPPNCYCINMNPLQSILLFAGSEHLLSWHLNLANQIVEKIQNTLRCNCRIVIGKPFSGAEEISKVYEATEHFMSKHFFASNTTVMTVTNEDASILDRSSHTCDDEILKQIQADVQFKDSDGLVKHMKNLTDSQKLDKNSSLLSYRFLCTNVLKILLDGLHRTDKEVFEEYAKTIYYTNHLSHIEALLLQLTDELAILMREEQESPKHALRYVKQYIHNHYSENLSLNLLAEKVYFTPRYLSAIFIEENGYGINNYIKKVRMEKATELLLGTNMKVNDICQKVGYSNLSYFCKSFAEEYGITPDKFRNTKNSFPSKTNY